MGSMIGMSRHYKMNRFKISLPRSTRDEVGELTRCFNKMTRQLKQRLLLKEAINVAREVQQNLLPHAEYSAHGIVVDGISNYCDETGGDYYDIIRFPGSDKKVGVVVGDDPAIVYSPESRKFSELKGKGIALGVDPEWDYESSELLLPDEEQLILIGSDGVWEVENVDGEQFGKDRVRKIMATTCDLDPDRILQSMIHQITEFKGENSQDDDITLAVIKFYNRLRGKIIFSLCSLW